MSKRKPFVIRDFNPSAEGYFNATGVIDNKQSFAEQVKEDFADAYTAVEQSPLNRDGTAPAAVDVITFKIGTLFDSKDDLRAARSSIRETIKRWSEKSRIRGTRGWRANAVKTPTFKKNLSTGLYDLKFEVILGRKVNYSENTVNANAMTTLTETYADLDALKKHLVQAAGQVRDFKYKHSRFGKGEVL